MNVTKIIAAVLGAATVTGCFAQTVSPLAMKISVALESPYVTWFSQASVSSAVVTGSIVAVDRHPAAGTWTSVSQSKGPGLVPQPLSDNGSSIVRWTFDIQQPDGTPVGAIVASASRVAANGDYEVISGTGVYIGITGSVTLIGTEWQQAADGSSARESMIFSALLQPLAVPVIAPFSGVPAVTHGSDSALVTARRPALPGEILTVYLTDPIPVLAVSSVRVRVGGIQAQVLFAGQNQINFRMPPEEFASAYAPLQAFSGFLPGLPVRIAVGRGDAIQ